MFIFVTFACLSEILAGVLWVKNTTKTQLCQLTPGIFGQLTPQTHILFKDFGRRSPWFPSSSPPTSNVEFFAKKHIATWHWPRFAKVSSSKQQPAEIFGKSYDQPMISNEPRSKKPGRILYRKNTGCLRTGILISWFIMNNPHIAV